MYQAFGSLCSIMIQTHNNSMSALIGFGKTTHDLKNRRASGWHLNLGRSPVPGNCSERKMVGMWWGQCSSSPGAISSHTPASLSCSVVKFELSKSWRLLWVLVVLVFVPSFKAFFVSCFVAMLCTITRDNGNTCSVKAQRREVGEGAAEELPSRLLPDVQVSSVRKDPSLPVCRQLETSSWWPSQGTEASFPFPLQCGCHSRALISPAQEELLGTGLSRHWSIWPESGGLRAESLHISALGQGRARLTALQDSAQVLSTGLGKWGEQT